jgi:hypothetical protein
VLKFKAVLTKSSDRTVKSSRELEHRFDYRQLVEPLAPSVAAPRATYAVLLEFYCLRAGLVL